MKIQYEYTQNQCKERARYMYVIFVLFGKIIYFELIVAIDAWYTSVNYMNALYLVCIVCWFYFLENSLRR